MCEVSFNIIHFAEQLRKNHSAEKCVRENSCKPKWSSYYLEDFVDYKEKLNSLI